MWWYRLIAKGTKEIFVKKYFLILFFPILLSLAGCGGGNDSNQLSGASAFPANSALARAQACIECHTGSVSPGTGKLIVEEYRASGHAAFNGAACPDCHGPSTKHSQSCQTCHGGAVNDPAAEMIKNPDEAKRCLICHGKTATRAPMVYGKFLKFSSEARHNHFPKDAPTYSNPAGDPNLFSNITTTGYVTAANVGKCRSCHNQHNNSRIPQFRQWADSGHANLKGHVFSKYDFKVRGTTGIAAKYLVPQIPVSGRRINGFCVRCHTTTGFINYVTSGFRNVSSWGNSNDPEKQVLYCNACHYSDSNGRSYNYTVRAPDAAKGFYNYSALATGRLLSEIQYPNLNQSNNCMNCHVGWNSGPQLKLIAQKAADNGYVNFFTTTAPNYGTNLNSHYFAAGSTIFRTVGYRYDGRNYEDESEYAHKQIGVDNFRGTTTRGPCVMCHVFPGRMTFLPVEREGESGTNQTGAITSIVSPTCSKCHDGSFKWVWTVERLNSVKSGYQAALGAFAWQLQVRKGIYFNPLYTPYLFTTANVNAANAASVSFKNWGNVGTAGAGFNYNYLWHDFGAFAHNSRFVKRLIYDSIDFLDNGVLDFSVGATLSGWNPADSNQRTQAMDYLLVNGTVTGNQAERL